MHVMTLWESCNIANSLGTDSSITCTSSTTCMTLTINLSQFVDGLTKVTILPTQMLGIMQPYITIYDLGPIVILFYHDTQRQATDDTRITLNKRIMSLCHGALITKHWVRNKCGSLNKCGTKYGLLGDRRVFSQSFYATMKHCSQVIFTIVKITWLQFSCWNYDRNACVPDILIGNHQFG
jgi:hypothetical protein